MSILNKPETMNTEMLLEALGWRYATKKFDAEQKLPPHILQSLLEAIRLSPSSMGLQPYVCLNVINEDMRAQLRAVSSDQPQITDASALVVFAAKKAITDTEVEDFVRLGGQLRGHTADAVEKRIASVKRFVNGHESDALFEWSARQAYIALGQLLVSAAVLHIDACPMEGIRKAEYDRILQLGRYNTGALAVVTLGYRSGLDHTATQAKVRKPLNELIINID